MATRRKMARPAKRVAAGPSPDTDAADARAGLMESARARDWFTAADTADIARLVEEAYDSGHRVAGITKTTPPGGGVSVTVVFKE